MEDFPVGEYAQSIVQCQNIDQLLDVLSLPQTPLSVIQALSDQLDDVNINIYYPFFLNKMYPQTYTDPHHVFHVVDLTRAMKNLGTEVSFDQLMRNIFKEKTLCRWRRWWINGKYLVRRLSFMPAFYTSLIVHLGTSMRRILS